MVRAGHLLRQLAQADEEIDPDARLKEMRKADDREVDGSVDFDRPGEISGH